jgi:hypothetical protein
MKRPAFLLPFSRWLLGLLGLCAIALCSFGCSSTAQPESDAQFEVTLDPSPPNVGDASVSLMLKDAQGSPLKDATVRVEGNMNHAGMKPSFADLEEIEPGKYEGTLDFTMGGDWFLLFTAETSDGKTISHKVDVPGVQSH